MWKARAEDGQATVELVAVLPVVGLVLLLAWQALVAGQTWWLASAAAREGARAFALGGDPAVAARHVLPDGADGVDVRAERDAVRVRLAIAGVLPGLDLGSVTARAHMEPQS
jgi:hypothetical protein